jgi:hypothetical protein
MLLTARPRPRAWTFAKALVKPAALTGPCEAEADAPDASSAAHASMYLAQWTDGELMVALSTRRYGQPIAKPEGPRPSKPARMRRKTIED